MARDTLTNARAELYNLLASDANGTPITALSTAGVVKVYDHEPKPGEAAEHCFVTVATGGMTPETYRYTVRVYVTGSIAADEAQDTLDTAVPAVDDAIDGQAQAAFGPSEWDFGWTPELGAFVALNRLECIRDF